MRTTAQRMPDRPLMLAEMLKAGGYSTGAAVGNVNLARAFNFDQGFDTYRELWREDDDGLNAPPEAVRMVQTCC